MTLEQLTDAVDKLSSASSAAQKYGPFYFALFLLLFVPFIAGTIIKRSANRTDDSRTREIILRSYDSYFRTCLYIGAFCTVSGVIWWFYQNYRFELEY